MDGSERVLAELGASHPIAAAALRAAEDEHHVLREAIRRGVEISANLTELRKLYETELAYAEREGCDVASLRAAVSGIIAGR